MTSNAGKHSQSSVPPGTIYWVLAITGLENGNNAVKLALSGCHDTTLAAVLASLGAFEGEPWPPYTSHIALELFKSADVRHAKLGNVKIEYPKTEAKSWFGGLFGKGVAQPGRSSGIARQKIESLSDAEKSELDDYYVRIRYNDRVMEIPGCKPAGKHLEGDTSFCTLVSVIKYFWL